MRSYNITQKCTYEGKFLNTYYYFFSSANKNTRSGVAETATILLTDFERVFAIEAISLFSKQFSGLSMVAESSSRAAATADVRASKFTISPANWGNKLIILPSAGTAFNIKRKFSSVVSVRDNVISTSSSKSTLRKDDSILY